MWNGDKAFLASGNKVEEVSNLIGLWMKRKERC
jgi:hypothetical protein